MSTSIHPGQQPAPQKKSRRATPEQLRAGTSMSRELSLSLLTADDRVVFEKFLEGDQDAMAAVKKANVASPLFNAQLHARADKLDIEEVIRRTVDDEEDDPAAAAVAAAAAKGIGLHIPAGVTVISGGQMGTTGSQQPLATAQDVQDAVSKWEGIYGPMRGEFSYDVFAAARNAESKVALMTLMDIGLVNEHSVHEIPWRFPDKQYASPKDHDILKEPYMVSILKKQSIPLIEALVEHAQGISMLKRGQAQLLSHEQGSIVKNEDKSLVLWVYKTQDMLFDEGQVELLDKFLSYIGSANISKPDDHATPPRKWMTFLAIKAIESDIPTLQMLVDKHNLELNVYDQYGGTPYIRAASLGNLPLIRFLQSNPPIDVLAKERMTSHDAKTALDYAEEGPQRRAREQDYTARQNAENEAAYLDTTIPEWEEACAVAEAKGEEPPKMPDEPTPEPIPPDYPLEIISIVQEAFANADPNLYKKEYTDPNVAQFDALDALQSGSDDDFDFSGM